MKKLIILGIILLQACATAKPDGMSKYYASNGSSFPKLGVSIANARVMFKTSQQGDLFLKYGDEIVEFLDLAKANGIDVSHVFNEPFVIIENEAHEKYEKRVATSHGRKRRGVRIVIHTKRYDSPKRSDLGRKYVLFHELSHDILNVAHIKEFGNLMSTSAKKKPTQIYFENAIWKMFAFINKDNG